MKKEFEEILKGYIDGSNVVNSNISYFQPLIHDLPEEISSIAGNDYKVKGSAGQGNKADYPWICIFDKRITESAQEGLYIAYLFRDDMSGFYLSLNQGVTYFLEKNSTADPKKTSKYFADQISNDRFTKAPISLVRKAKPNSKKGKQYESTNIISKFYDLASLDDSVLKADLEEMLKIYKDLVDRFSGSTYQDVIDKVMANQNQSLQSLFSINNTWIIPCDLKTYNVDGAFNKFDTIYWKQSTNVSKGDTIFLYVSGTVGRICYKCDVLEADCPLSKVSEIDDSEFVLDGSNYANYPKHMLIQLKKVVKNANLSLFDLRNNGLNGNIQGPQKVTGSLLKYISDEVSKCKDSRQNMKKILFKDNLEDRNEDNKVDALLKQNITPNVNYEPEPAPTPKQHRNGRLQYPRDPKRRANALVLADFLCEYDTSHPSFIRKSNSKPYTEAHHLIPLNAQGLDQFKNINLDCEANIVSLCSQCHNQLHYGIGVEAIITRLYNDRKAKLLQCGIKIELDELLKFYK